mgnify:CR=1 FL=1
MQRPENRPVPEQGRTVWYMAGSEPEMDPECVQGTIIRKLLETVIDLAARDLGNLHQPQSGSSFRGELPICNGGPVKVSQTFPGLAVYVIDLFPQGFHPVVFHRIPGDQFNDGGVPVDVAAGTERGAPFFVAPDLLPVFCHILKGFYHDGYHLLIRPERDPVILGCNFKLRQQPVDRAECKRATVRKDGRIQHR